MDEQARTNPTAARPGATRGSGRNGMPIVALTNASGAAADLYLHGAHVTSWRTADAVERLFLSEQARFHPDAGIRGGIPIVFPQFGPGELPQHGFARKQEWTLEDHGADAEGAAFARLSLRDSATTRALWPHTFRAEVTVRLLATALDVQLTVENTGEEAWQFTAALHTYFRVRHIGEVRIRGLQGLRFRDKTRGGSEWTDEAGAVPIGEETDRVYFRTPPVLRIADAGGVLRVEKHGFADAVVWNPWIQWSRDTEDFGNDEYLRMVCVEAAQVGDPVRLAPGERWAGRQILATEGTTDG